MNTTSDPNFRCQFSRLRIAAFLVGGGLWLTAALVRGESPSPVTAWPEFRGPGGQGGVSQTLLPVHLSDDPEALVWKTPLPSVGHASPVHDGNSIWLSTADPQGKSLGVIALNAETGTIEREITLFTPARVDTIHHDNSYASPTPVLSAGKLFVHYGTYGTACVDTASGDVLWKNDRLPVEHQGGPGSSPVLFEDLLIITLDGADVQQVVALDVNTGEPRWQTNRSVPYEGLALERRAFSTPLLSEVNGRTQLISPAAQQCHAYDPRTGEELWHVRYQGFSNVPRPVVRGDHCYLCTGFYGPQLMCVRMNGEGDVTETHVEWTMKGQVPETPSPVLGEEGLYMISNKGVLTCVDLETGKRKWMQRIGGNHSASPMLAGNLLYLCSEEGLLRVIDVTSADHKPIAVNRLGKRIMASPALLGDDLLIRTDESLALYRRTSATTGQAQGRTD